MITEQKVPVLDYTWDWRNGVDLDEDAPFRYVFPQVRLNANVNEHPRGSLLAFADGGLINVMPGQMHSHLLADHPELVKTLRHLAPAQAVLAVLLRGAVPPRRGSDRDGVPCPPLHPR